VLTVTAVVVAASVVLLLTRDDGGGTPVSAVKARVCPTSTPVASALKPSDVTLSLLNGTSRNGLAKQVLAQLTARGFVVTSADTAPAALPGPTQVVWGPGALPKASLLAEHLGVTQLVKDPLAAEDFVQATLGDAFTRLVTPPVKPAPTPSTCASR